jgi:hypothetical protein
VGATPTVLATGVAQAVAEGWDGTAWTVQQVPANPSATGSYLTGVSCTPAGDCTAAGLYTYGVPPVPGAPLGSRTLAEAWNGTSWTLTPTPDVTSSADALHGVSCAAAQACTAVGRTTDPGGILATLVEANS